MCDLDGVIYGRAATRLDPHQGALRAATTPPRTLAEALEGADVFVGLPSAGR